MYNAFNSSSMSEASVGDGVKMSELCELDRTGSYEAKEGDE